ncbi:MAG: hypothetical protein OCU12_07730 [Methanophagales archaeon]|nr:hypothetical protein [Methanophagales archaeon]
MLPKGTFIRVLKGAPLSVCLALLVHGSMGQTKLKRYTGYDRATIKDALEWLEDLELVVRPNYRKWAITDGFRQLPLARDGYLGTWGNGDDTAVVSGELENPESGISPLSIQIERTESGISPLSIQIERTESGISPLSADDEQFKFKSESGNSPLSLCARARADQIRSDDDDDEEDGRWDIDLQNDLRPEERRSEMLLDLIGIGGNNEMDYIRMVGLEPAYVLGTYYYLSCQDWVRSLTAVMYRHLLDEKKTPLGFVEFAEYWLTAGLEDKEELVTAVQYRGFAPDGVGKRLFRAASEIWKAHGSFEIE